MSITSSDLSVLYEFQWLIGLFRYSISPLKQRPTTGAVGTDPEMDRRKSFSDLGKRLLSCIYLPFPSFFNKKWRGQVDFHDWPLIALPGSTCHPSSQNFLEAWNFLSLCRAWNFNPRSVCLPRSPGLGGRNGCRHHQARGTGRNRLRQEHQDPAHFQDPRLAHSVQTSPGFSALFSLLWYHQKSKFLVQS